MTVLVELLYVTLAATGLPPLGVSVKLIVLACTASLKVARHRRRHAHVRTERLTRGIRWSHTGPASQPW